MVITMTNRLYYEDSYIRDFTSEVLSCESSGDKYEVILRDSAFYPGGGGQPCDTGMISGAKVTEVFTRGEDIVHVTDREVHGTVEGHIDFRRRFALMQNHSGEHIVSGIMHSLFGANNVGFHMGSEDVTLDLDVKITDEELSRVEVLANRAIYENIEIRTYFPTESELCEKSFRSKKDFPSGTKVRLVEIGGYDLCACAATHVRYTGEIGIIRLISMINYKGGVRIHMLCGEDALSLIQRSFGVLSGCARSLSVKPEELPEAIERLNARISESKEQISRLNRELFAFLVDGAQCPVFIREGLGNEEMRLLANMASEKFSRGIVFSKNGEEFLFTAVSKDKKAKMILQKLKEKLTVSGGGNDDMVTGRCTGNVYSLDSEIFDF